MLDAVEAQRRARYRRPDDRDRFTLGAALLRIALGVGFGVAPEAVRIDRTCPRCGAPHGKPRAPDYPVDVSVGHSGDYVAVALSTAGPVGVDVELMRPVDHTKLAVEICAPDEQGSVTSERDLYVYWTRKESVLKAAGIGLTVPLWSLAVTSPSDAPRLLRTPDGMGLTATLRDLSTAPGYAGAVTVLAKGPITFRAHPADDGPQLLTCDAG